MPHGIYREVYDPPIEHAMRGFDNPERIHFIVDEENRILFFGYPFYDCECRIIPRNQHK